MKRKAGDIEYELTLKRIKNVNMRVRTDGSVSVSAPYGTDRGFIDDFVLSRKRFIAAARRKMSIRQPVPEITADKAAIYAKLYDVLQKTYKRFSEYGFAMPELRIRKMKSQWGNCRKERGIITLNAYLYGLPPECIELVAAHELSHMIEANHSPAFYSVLTKAMPDWKSRDMELKKFRLKC
ncbi:MAG: DUF45 domain-containing protein [Oscillospiraceae bacterium]|nr:DUF45 domain-containing protein [Oscillospiraceae bacterium]